MDINNVIVYLACIIILFLIGRFFVVPLKIIIKILGNSILGGIIIYIVNVIGGGYGFHIGLNIITTLVVGILGIPRGYITNNFKTILIILENYVKFCYNDNHIVNYNT